LIGTNIELGAKAGKTILVEAELGGEGRKGGDLLLENSLE
jgi:hypothetical protein